MTQFLHTVRAARHAGPLIVYDLGLDVGTRCTLEDTFQGPNIHFKTFDFSKYPSYYDIRVEAGQYAWKPAILWEVVQEITTPLLLWCDAGNKIVGPLAHLQQCIAAESIYSPVSIGTVGMWWTHQGMQSYFSIQPNDTMLLKSPRNGAILGFHVENPRVRDFIKNYAELAEIRDCIAPEGSDRSNHRQDQALFTILYYRSPIITKREPRQISLTIHNDID